MRSRKRSLSIVAVVAMATAGIGIASSAGASTAPPSTEPAGSAAAGTEAAPAETAPPPTAPERGTADLVIWTDDTRQQTVQDIAGPFAEENGITVAVQELNFGDIRDQLTLTAPSGEGPDIVIGAHDWLGELGANGGVEPLAPIPPIAVATLAPAPLGSAPAIDVAPLAPLPQLVISPLNERNQRD